MTCHDARELFSALIDETLTRGDRADVYGHLATCAECRRELAAIERTVALVRGASPLRAPVGFVDRVMAAARPTPWYVRAARAAVIPWPVKLPLGAAAVVLVAGLAVLMFRGGQEQQDAARYDTAPSVLADRRVAERPAESPAAPPATATAPAAPPATPPAGETSSDRVDSASEADRNAAVASRVDPAKKAETGTRLESKTQDAAPAETFSNARAKAAAPEVLARLAAPDRDTAERGLAALVARLSGQVTGRRVEGDTTVIELTIPGDRYGDFAREAGRLGVLHIESEPYAATNPLRIIVRLAS